MGTNTSGFSFCLRGADQAIVEAIRVALEIEMVEIMIDHRLSDRNGYGQFRWNVINARLKDCRRLGWLEVNTCTRGGWRVPVLFHEASESIITLMTEETFLNVQRRKDKNKHYLSGAASYNINVAPKYKQLELDLPESIGETDEWVAKSRNELARAIYIDVGDIKGHILVLFDVKNDRLLRVRAIRLTPSLEISNEEEDWSHYIGVPYKNDYVEPQATADDEEEELVDLL